MGQEAACNPWVNTCFYSEADQQGSFHLVTDPACRMFSFVLSHPAPYRVPPLLHPFISKARLSLPAPIFHAAIIAAKLPSQPLSLGKVDCQSYQCKPHLPTMNDILGAILYILDKSCLQTKCDNVHMSRGEDS